MYQHDISCSYNILIFSEHSTEDIFTQLQRNYMDISTTLNTYIPSLHKDLIRDEPNTPKSQALYSQISKMQDFDGKSFDPCDLQSFNPCNSDH